MTGRQLLSLEKKNMRPRASRRSSAISPFLSVSSCSSRLLKPQRAARCSRVTIGEPRVRPANRPAERRSGARGSRLGRSAL
ncbi:hypothetical protein Q8A67_020074 [Cirrhinus molitorella]|uniref:Uncharacterized protein n=1 Tax=Cirrhinus molitorella TaxID=172907 RepID=A0AA88P4N2_9TELE|nr:hypothetical protein Q8A67_020074 [Cirrhinus molitorella]